MNPSLSTALRNALITKWLTHYSDGAFPTVSYYLASQYAEWAKLPVDEVVGALDQITDVESLDWFWSRFEADMRDFERDDCS